MEIPKGTIVPGSEILDSDLPSSNNEAVTSSVSKMTSRFPLVVAARSAIGGALLFAASILPADNHSNPFLTNNSISKVEAASLPEYRLGFKALCDGLDQQVPNKCTQVMGSPTEDEHWGANGDSLQLTTKGMAAWRKADNWTAFTNGSRTWVNGPVGVQDRDNSARFPFEDGGQTVEQVTGYPFPKQIGNLDQDHVVIYNKGTLIGVTDNRENPQNNWQAVAAVAKRYAPNDRFEIFFYDNPNEVPIPPSPQKYDINMRWSVVYPGAQDAKQLYIQNPEGIWQWHISLPANIRPEDLNAFSSNIADDVLLFFISKDNVLTTWKDDFSAILRQQAGDPSLKLVTVPSAK